MMLATRPAPARLDRPTRESFRLRGRAHKAALTAHILSSVGWFGVAVVVAFCGIAASASADPTLPSVLYRTMETAPWLSIPIGLIAVASGVLLGLGTKYGLVRYWWVVAKMVISVAVIVTDGLLIGQVARHAAQIGHASSPLYGSTIAHVVVLAIATGLSVFKPRGRTRWGRRGARPLSNQPAAG